LELFVSRSVSHHRSILKALLSAPLRNAVKAAVARGIAADSGAEVSRLAAVVSREIGQPSERCQFSPFKHFQLVQEDNNTVVEGFVKSRRLPRSNKVRLRTVACEPYDIAKTSAMQAHQTAARGE
jgi:hypothetical protein